VNQAWWLTPVIPATQKVEIGRTVVQDQAEQKVSETPISTNKKLGMVAQTCHPGHAVIGRRIEVQA
jgi:hypothetical protein